MSQDLIDLIENVETVDDARSLVFCNPSVVERKIRELGTGHPKYKLVTDAVMDYYENNDASDVGRNYLGKNREELRKLYEF